MPYSAGPALRDANRLASLHASQLLDTPPEPAFDRLTALAARCTGAPVALVSLVDADRQFFKSTHGLPAALAHLRETPLSHCLCQHEVATGAPLVLEDARSHPLARDNGAVRELGVAAYAGVPLRSADGHVLGSLCVVDFVPRAWDAGALEALAQLGEATATEIELRRELADRARLEAALRESDRFSRVLFDASPDCVKVLDLAGRLERINGRGCQLMEIDDPAIVLGADWATVWPAESEGRARGAVRAALAGGTGRFTGFCPTLRGAPRWWDVTVAPVRDVSDNVVRLLVVSHDVTERQEAAARLARSEAHFRALIEQIGELISVLDVEGRIVYANPAYAHVLGREPDDAVGLCCFDLVHPDDLARVAAVFGEAVATPGGVVSAEYRARRLDGTWATLSSTARNLLHDPSVAGIVVNSRDVTESRLAEAELRASEARLAEAQAMAHVGSWAVNAETGAVWWSEELYRLFGRDPRSGALSLDAFIGALHPDDQAHVRDEVFVAPGAPATFELAYRVVLPDGSVRMLSEHGQRRFAPDGTLREVVGTAQDVTEQVTAETALRVSEARFRALAERAPLGIFLADDAGGVLYANPHLAAVFGRPAEAIRAHGWVGLVHPDDHDRVNAAYAAFFPDPTVASRRDEFRVVRADGEVRWIVVESVRAASTDAAAGGFVGAVTDVTEQRAAEEALRESEERLRLALDVAGVVVWERDLRTDRLRDVALPSHDGLTHVRAGALGSYGCFLDGVHEDDRERVAAVNAEAVAARSEFSIEYRTVDAAGTERWSHTVARVLAGTAGTDGTPERMIGVSRDVTAHRTLEAQFRQAQKMEAVGRLAGGVAHDFNNLLMVIGAGSLFAREAIPPDSPARQELADVDAAVQRAAALTKQLLAFSRQQVLRPERLQLNRVVANVERMLSRVLGEDIRLMTEPARELPQVLADTGQLEQVLMNLAVNARDAMPHGGTLTVQTAAVRVGPRDAPAFPGVAAGEYVALRVRDTGVGMDAATRARIFEPFFTTKEPGRGTGLGLATVYGIVQQSDGHVLVDSAPSAGTTFTVLLPRVDDAVAATHADAIAPAVPHGSERILLVEDEPTLRAAVRRMLERGGYVVYEARHGVDALALAERQDGAIDLVLTDVVMPELGAAGLVERLRARRPAMRVLLMSGYHAQRFGAHEVAGGLVTLTKPFTPDARLRQVRTCLDA
ncbi:MAG: PAS domain S-box protein [Gemmatirosa sp.]